MATASPAATAGSSQPSSNRWAVLALLGVAQLMVVLDATIVNIALPSAQRALGFSTDSRQWVVTAYALAFGSLLLLGGKLGDLFGRKWTFIAGLSRLRHRLGDRRSGAVLRHARRRAGAAGRVRRAAGPVRAGASHGHVRRLAGPREGVRHLRRDRRRRRIGRPAARRRADAAAVLALVPVRQRPDRDPDGARSVCGCCQTTVPRRARDRRTGRSARAPADCSHSSSASRTPRRTRGRRR